MPPLETIGRVHKAVWWRRVGTDAYDKAVVTPSPSEVSVLWIDSKKDVLDPNGQKVTTEAQLQLNFEVKVGDLFWKGELEDFYGTGSGNPETQVMEVVKSSTTPDIKGRNTAYDASLIRFKGSLPQRG